MRSSSWRNMWRCLFGWSHDQEPSRLRQLQESRLSQSLKSKLMANSILHTTSICGPLGR